MLASQAAEALALRRLRDSGRLSKEEYTERLGSAEPAWQPRLPGAWEILERCRAARVHEKIA
jgi:hypothetical protein